MLKKRVKIALMVLAAMLLLYLLPFILYMLVNNNNRQFMFEQLVYKELCYSITQDAKTDSAKIMQVFEYVSNNCRQPQGNENPKYTNTYDVLTHKTGSCDQQVWLMMALLRVEDIDAQMVFLRGSDSISHHTVAEVEINKKWVMLDPFYSHHYPNNQGNIASIDDIISGNIPLRDYYAMPESYRNLFAKQYPYKIHSNNKLDTSRCFIRSMIWGYRAILGKLFTMPFEALH